MENLERILTEHPVLRGLEQCHVDLLISCASNVRFDAGQMVFREGGQADHFYLIRQGKVLLEIPMPARGSVGIRTLEKGDILGWAWFVPPYRWRFDARAVDGTLAIAFDAKCLRNKFENNRELGYEMLKRFVPMLAGELDATRLQLLDIFGNPPSIPSNVSPR